MSNLNTNIDAATLPLRVRNLAQRIHSQLGLWPWQLLSSFPSVQRYELNPTYWSIHTIESLSALVTREIEAQARAQTKTNETNATSATTRRTRSTATKQALEPRVGVQSGANVSKDAVAERIASQLAQAVDDRIRRQTRVSRSGDTVLSTPKRPCLTCQDIKKILNIDGDKDRDQDGEEGVPPRAQKRRRSYHHERPPSHAPSEELGVDFGMGQHQSLYQDQDQDQDQDRQQQLPTQTAAPTIPAPEFDLENIDPALRNRALPGPSSSPYGPLLMLTEAAATHRPELASPSPHQDNTDQGNINVKVNGGQNVNVSEKRNRNGYVNGARRTPNINDSGPDLGPPRPSQAASPTTSRYPRSQHARNSRLSTPFRATLIDRRGNLNKRIRLSSGLSSGRAGSGAGSDHSIYDEGSYRVSDDEDGLVLKDLSAPDSFVDDHERAATVTLTTTSRQETQRLQDEIAKLHENLVHLRAKLTEENKTASNEEISLGAAETIAETQQRLYATEAKLKERNNAERLLASAIQAAGDSDTISQMKTVFESYQRETQQNYAAPVASLKANLVRAEEEAASLDAARFTAIQAKKDIEHDINETKKGIRKYEKRLRLWSAYNDVIRLGPINLASLLGEFQGMEDMLRDACVELDLNGAGAEGDIDEGSGLGSESG